MTNSPIQKIQEYRVKFLSGERFMKSIFSLFSVLFISIFFGVGCATTPVVDFEGTRIEDAVEQRLFSLVNEYRLTEGLPPIASSDVLRAKARTHSENMAQKKVPFNHNGFEERVAEIRNQIDVQYFSENISLSRGNDPNPADAIFASWKKSREHNRNLLGDYNLTGIGVVQNQKGDYYTTQIFIKKY